MRRVVILVLVVSLIAIVRGLGGPTLPGDVSVTALALGFTVVAAIVMGSLTSSAGLPKVTGYMLLGVLAGPFVLGLISEPMTHDLRLFNGIAVALIALLAGLEIDLQALAMRTRKMMAVTVSVMSIVLAGCFAMVLLLGRWLPFLAPLHGSAYVSVALVTAVLIASFSPTVTMAVIAESRARGRFTDLVLSVTILADLLLVVFFTFALVLARSALAAGPSGESTWARIGVEVGGALLAGAVTGVALGVYVRWLRRGVPLVMVAVCAVIAQLSIRFQLSPVLFALAAGLVATAVARVDRRIFRDWAEQGALPVLAVFFAGAGASLDLDALWRMLPFVAALSVTRAGLARVATLVGFRLGGERENSDRLLWRALVSQAGVTLGLVTIVAREFPGWGRQVETLLLALIALHELVGPVAFLSALRAAGDLGRPGMRVVKVAGGRTDESEPDTWGV